MEASGYAKNENVHHFLQELFKTSQSSFVNKNSEAEKVTKIAKDHFHSFFSPFKSVDTGKNIYKALQQLKSDIPHMSPRIVEDELTGAQYGLMSLFNQGPTGPETTDLKNWLKFVNKCKSYAHNVFYIKTLATENPNLSSTLNDRSFLRLYEQFIDLSGRDQLDAKTILSLALFCKDHPQQINLLEEILKTGTDTREINRQLVIQGIMPMIEDSHNKHFMHELMPKITQYYANNFREEYKDFKKILDEIYFNRVFIPNTQMHKDGLYLAFNSSDKNPHSTRMNGRIQQHEKFRAEQLKELQDKEVNENDPAKKQALQRELEILNSLTGYYPRASGSGFETARWEPLIEADHPLSALDRIIGLANVWGQKNETVTPLDLTQTLGEENLALTIKEKQILSRLLIACDTVFLKDPKVLDSWIARLPVEIQTVLAAFSDSTEYPHLSQLSEEKKLELVKFSLEFARDVNLNFARVFFDLD